MPNRLAALPSPYLRQHADNPVDWWPWGQAAFAEAQRLDRPIFLSIGYAACHWCHVMAHESFESEATAALMNELFINIKVDREERPEVDAIYMNAIQVMGEGGGWPLSAFCLPDGRPYFLGTYFPVTPRFGRPSFQDVLRAMSAAFHTRRGDAEDNATALLEGLMRVDAHYRRGAREASDASQVRLDTALLIAAGKQLAERCDPARGGLRGEPKFPSSSSHDLLARASRFSFGEAAKTAFLAWARGMAEGGIYDHLGGGFSRYSVDAKWLVPHFEKMLYDQAQLLSIYSYAVALGDERAREIIIETVGFLDRELSDPSGGLWSSLDADSEGEEGKYYVWTPAQVREILGPAGALVFNHAYGVTEAGNFEHNASVLSRVTDRTSDDEEAHLAQLRAQLLAARNRRVRPGTDDKVLAGWNALAITGLVSAWHATGHAAALALALRVANFIRQSMIDPAPHTLVPLQGFPRVIGSAARPGGAGAIDLSPPQEERAAHPAGAAGTGVRVARVFHAGAAMPLDGTLDDYAYCAEAFLVLAEATGDRSWWDLGARIAAAIRARFVDEQRGALAFFLTPANEPLLVHRPESHHDSALPAGAAVAIAVFIRLGLVAGDADALALAEKYLVQRLADASAGSAAATSALLGALDLYLNAKICVVTEGYGRDELASAARSAFAPTRCLAGPWAHASLLEGKESVAGRARAFVCTGPVCSPPVDDPHELARLMGAQS